RFRVVFRRQPRAVGCAAVAVGGRRMWGCQHLHLGTGNRLALLVHHTATRSNAGFQPERELGRELLTARHILVPASEYWDERPFAGPQNQIVKALRQFYLSDTRS